MTVTIQELVVVMVVIMVMVMMMMMIGLREKLTCVQTLTVDSSQRFALTRDAKTAKNYNKFYSIPFETRAGQMRVENRGKISHVLTRL